MGVLSSVTGILGKLAKVGGAVATVAGAPMVGIPLMMGGGIAEGASTGGVTGALKSGAQTGISLAAPMALGKVAAAMKPTAEGFTAYSSTGNPITVPGARVNPISVFSSSGSPMTASANKAGGS